MIGTLLVTMPTFLILALPSADLPIIVCSHHFGQSSVALFAIPDFTWACTVQSKRRPRLKLRLYRFIQELDELGYDARGP